MGGGCIILCSVGLKKCLKLFRWLTVRDVSLLDVFSALLFFDIIKEGEKRTKSVEADAGLVAQYEGMP